MAGDFFLSLDFSEAILSDEGWSLLGGGISVQASGLGGDGGLLQKGGLKGGGGLQVRGWDLVGGDGEAGREAWMGKVRLLREQGRLALGDEIGAGEGANREKILAREES